MSTDDISYELLFFCCHSAKLLQKGVVLRVAFSV